MNRLEVKSNFKKILDQENRLSKNSIRNRKSTLNKVLNNMIRDEKEFTEKNIIAELEKIKYKTDLSACVNAIRYLKKSGVQFEFPTEEKLREIISSKSKNKRLPKKEKNISSIENKVNRVRDKQSRVAFKFMLKTGLRVHEAAALKKEDFSIEKNKIICNMRVAKNSKVSKLEFEDKYLSENLKDLLNCDRENVFPSERFLQRKAKDIGIECHDLRRIHAKKLYKTERKEKGYSEALDAVRESLRHSNKKTTKIYLNSKLK